MQSGRQRPSLRARMAFFEDFGEVFFAVVDVLGGNIGRAMPQYQANQPEICAVLRQMRRAGMAQAVQGDVLFERGIFVVDARIQFLHIVVIQRTVTLGRDEEKIAAMGRELGGAHLFQVGAQAFPEDAHEGHKTLFAALAVADEDVPLLPVHVAILQFADFAAAHPGRVGEVDDGVIGNALRRCARNIGKDDPDFFRRDVIRLATLPRHGQPRHPQWQLVKLDPPVEDDGRRGEGRTRVLAVNYLAQIGLNVCLAQRAFAMLRHPSGDAGQRGTVATDGKIRQFPPHPLGREKLVRLFKHGDAPLLKNHHRKLRPLRAPILLPERGSTQDGTIIHKKCG